jgi:PRTRC genetic system protein C
MVCDQIFKSTRALMLPGGQAVVFTASSNIADFSEANLEGVEDVRGALAMQYPEIATAAISGPEAVDDTMKYTFERAIGSKG